MYPSEMDRSGSQLVFDGDTVDSLAGDLGPIDGVISVLFSTSAEQWDKSWKQDIHWRPTKYAIINVTDVTRSARATSPQRSGPMIPGRGLSLQTLSRPVDPLEIVDRIEAYLPSGDDQDLLIIVDSGEELLDPSLRAFEQLAAIVDTTGVRFRCGLAEGSLTTEMRHRLDPLFETRYALDSVREAIDSLRSENPTTYGYTRQHWREARSAIERCSRNYPKAKQVHDVIDIPDTTPRTLGTALSGFVSLSVIGTWSETVGSTRYDLTAYDPARMDAVGRVFGERASE